MIAGAGGYEVGSGYENSMHSTLIDDACITCHMADAYGIQAGGHQMGAAYEYHGHTEPLVAGCTNCHEDEDALITKLENTQTEINGLLAELKTILMDKSLLSEDDYVTGPDGEYASSGNPAETTADELGAILNYQLVREDRSAGVHNYAYAKALLENSIASLQD
jgi:hypothetical protein